MKRHILIIFAICSSFGAYAQDIYRPILEEIATNCREIRVYEREHDATVAENATGMTPANPEVEFGYLWGNKLTGNRKDVSVTQEFDFPTLYGKKRGVAQKKDASAASLLRSQRLDVLLEAKLMLIDLTYWNALRLQAEEQLGYAQKILDAQNKLMNLGETTIIDLNKARLNYSDFENEVSRIDMERKTILDRLTALNGGNVVNFETAAFPEESLPTDFGEWFAEAEKESPALQYLRSQIEVSHGNVAVAKAEGLPKFSVGYQGEYVMGSNFSGVTVGVSVPLWENRHRVRQARAEAAAAEERLTDARQDYFADLQYLFNKARTLGEIEKSYKKNLQEASNDALLFRALEKGQLTLLEYVTESQYVFSMREKLVAAQRDRAAALARLTAHRL